MKTNNKKAKIIILSVTLGGFFLLFLVSLFVTSIVLSFIQIHEISFAPKFFFHKSGLLIAFLVALGCTIGILFYFMKFRIYTDPKVINTSDRADSDLFGTSRLLTFAEKKEYYGWYDYNTLPDVAVDGIVVSSAIEKDKDGNNHFNLSILPKQNSIIVGGTGSGKSTILLVPTILANAKSKTKASMIVLDPKGVIYESLKLNLAQEGYKIHLIDLNNPRAGGRYNPLFLIYYYYSEYLKDKKTGSMYLDTVGLLINELAAFLIPTNSTDPKWEQGGQGIVFGTLWAMLEDTEVEEFRFTKEKFTLTQLSNILNRQRDHLEDYLTKRSRTSPAPEQAAAIIGVSSDKTVSSYMSTIGASLRSFLDGGIKYLTSGHDMDYDFVTTPTVLFIVIPDSQQTRDPMGALIISQLYRSLLMQAMALPNGSLSRPVYFLIDEFGNLPKIHDFLKWISMCRSRNIYFSLIIQAFGQLQRIYGDTGKEEIFSNCPLQLFLGTTDSGTIEKFSKDFGTYTAYQRSKNFDVEKMGTQLHGGVALVSRDVVPQEYLRNIKFQTIYFKEFRRYGAKGHLVPVFDKDLSSFIIYNNKVPVNFAFDPALQPPAYAEVFVDDDALYFDINERNKIFNKTVKTINKNTTEEDFINESESFAIDDDFNLAGIDSAEIEGGDTLEAVIQTIINNTTDNTSVTNGNKDYLDYLSR